MNTLLAAASHSLVLCLLLPPSHTRKPSAHRGTRSARLFILQALGCLPLVSCPCLLSSPLLSRGSCVLWMSRPARRQHLYPPGMGDVTRAQRRLRWKKKEKKEKRWKKNSAHKWSGIWNVFSFTISSSDHFQIWIDRRLCERYLYVHIFGHQATFFFLPTHILYYLLMAFLQWEQFKWISNKSVKRRNLMICKAVFHSHANMKLWSIWIYSRHFSNTQRSL